MKLQTLPYILLLVFLSLVELFTPFIGFSFKFDLMYFLPSFKAQNRIPLTGSHGNTNNFNAKATETYIFD